jgi:hypothetical protein
LSPPTHVEPIAKQPLAKVIPLAKVDVATAPVIFKYLASIPPLKVEVELLETLSTPRVEEAAKRLVEEAVVAKVAPVEVELVVVD